MMQALDTMEQTVGWHVKDKRGCNDLVATLVSRKRNSASIKSDLDRRYQDICLDKRSTIPAAPKDSQPSDKHSNSDTESMRTFEEKARTHNELLDENVKGFFATHKLELPKNWSELGKRERLEVLDSCVRQFYPNVPASLVTNISGLLIPGDSENQPSEVPDWLDKEKFARGQRLARDNFFGISYSQSLSLYVLYSFEDGLKPIIMTGRSSDPYTSFKRFLSTASRMRNWFTSDPWTKGTPAYNDMQVVNSLHSSIRKKLQNISMAELDELAKIQEPMAVRRDLLLEDFRACCPVPRVGQHPFAMPGFKTKRPKGLSQGEMGMTIFGFIGLSILYPAAFGMHYVTEEDLDDVCHLWRGLGYLLGISDEFNFCRGNLKETQQRGRDFLEYFVKPNFREIPPEFEHMMRCVFEGLEFYFPGLSYDSALLYLTDLMGLQMPRLRASMSYSSWFKYNFTKSLMCYSLRLDWIKSYLNRRATTMLDAAFVFDDEKHTELRKRSKEIVLKVLKSSHL